MQTTSYEQSCLLKCYSNKEFKTLQKLIKECIFWLVYTCSILSSGHEEIFWLICLKIMPTNHCYPNYTQYTVTLYDIELISA